MKKRLLEEKFYKKRALSNHKRNQNFEEIGEKFRCQKNYYSKLNCFHRCYHFREIIF